MTSGTVYLVYGLGEGRWHGRLFVKELESAGYIVVDDIHKADIVITHSGGPYALPANTTPKQLIMINPVYWPGKSWFTSFGQKLWRDFVHCYRTHRLGYFCRKTVINIWYMLTRVMHTATMAKTYNTMSFADMLPSCHIMVIRNKNDPWCTPSIAKSVPLINTLLELPGEHDDCWTNPASYMRLLQSKP